MPAYQGPVLPGYNEELYHATGRSEPIKYSGPVPAGYDQDVYHDTGKTVSAQPEDTRMHNDGIWTYVGDKRFRSESDAKSYIDEQEKAAAEKEAAEAKMRGAIQESYKPIYSYYDEAPDRLRQQAQNQQDYIGTQFGNMQGGIQDTKQHGLQQLDRSRQQITQNKATTLRDLAQNLRDTFRAGNMYLGTRGASDSSAAGMMGFALQKAANKNTADVNRQAMQQYGDVDQRAADVEYQAGKALKDAETWKASQLVNVTSWLNESLDKVQRDKALAQGEEKQALANLEQNLFQQASNRLAEIDNAMLQYQMYVKQLAAQEQASVGQYQNTMSQQSAYQPQGLNATLLNQIQGAPTTQQKFSPYARPYSEDDRDKYQGGYNQSYA